VPETEQRPGEERYCGVGNREVFIKNVVYFFYFGIIIKRPPQMWSPHSLGQNICHTASAIAVWLSYNSK
jgi:hypothetical protein